MSRILRAPPGLAQARVENARESLRPPRPPQHQTGENHHDGPGGRQFHQQGSAVSRHEFAVQAEDALHQAFVLVYHLQDTGVARMNVDAKLILSLADDDLRCGPVVPCQFVEVQVRSGNGGES